jgi:Zn-finger nucleic acid-binding protein
MKRSLVMNCPKCKAAMEPVTMETLTVDRCTACKGIWFDGNEVKKMRDTRGSEKIDTGDVHKGHEMNKITEILCPRCDRPMVERWDVDQHHIRFEACENCQGVYLDAGEFKDWKSYSVMDYFKGLFKHGKPKK